MTNIDIDSLDEQNSSESADSTPVLKIAGSSEVVNLAPTPAAEAPVSVGGMTLKKRAGGTPAPTGGSTDSRPTGGGGAGAPQLRFGGAPGGFGAPRPTGPSPNAQKRMERFSRVMPTRDPGVRLNENIWAPEIRVIDEEGMVGVMSPRAAMDLARARGVDLIEIVPNAQPPVCKLMDFGKWKYEQQKRDKLQKKTTHQQLLKEVRFHPNTDDHDFEFKVRHAREFLLEGDKVKASVQFKGREVAYKQFGEELLTKFKARLEDLAKVDQDLSMMGRTMSMTLSPLGKKKKEEPKNPADEEKRPRPPKVAKDQSVLSSAKDSDVDGQFELAPPAELKIRSEATAAPETVEESVVE